MEQLLHYTWKHRLFPLGQLTTTDGQSVEVIDPGLHNYGAGPDFFNAKLSIGGQMWVGNVEIHERASDWFRHHHETDAAYNSVVLHVVSLADCAAETQSGQQPPQLELAVPDYVEANYRELLAEESYPPCYRVIPLLPQFTIHSWLNALTIERLESKTERIGGYLEKTCGDWERALFVALARAFGFGTNADAFERWALSIDPQHIGKHRDDPMQVEAFFFGQAGLLDGGVVAPDRQDDHFLRLQREYRFLRTKFGVEPIDAKAWKFGRLRPQNSPYVRLAQLAALYTARRLDFSRVRKTATVDGLRALLRERPLAYWEHHYTFGIENSRTATGLSDANLDLLIINAVAPILFAYGRSHHDEGLTERAFALLEGLGPEHNYITRSWARAGVVSEHAADSQALIELRTRYCDRKDCLRCRFGTAYMKKAAGGGEVSSAPQPPVSPQ